MTRRRAALVLVGLATTVLAACASTGIPAASSSSATASVTQSAPSVWSAPDTHADSLPGIAGSTADATDAAPSTSELPGLSTACSAAIRAQLAVNNLFSAALKGAAPTGATGASNSPSALPTATASPGVPTSVDPTEDRLANITTKQVADVFDALAPSIPGTLAKPLAALHAAADTIVGKAVAKIPSVLNNTENLTAMRAFSDYIASCKPTSTE